jgi:hypothetical protein
MKELCKVSLNFTGSFIPCCYFDTQFFLVVCKVTLTVGEIGKEKVRKKS